MEYKFLKSVSKNNKLAYSFCENDEAEFVLLPINEFNGMKKAVRIVNDRALQQVDKSKTDEFGFRLLRAELRYCKEAKGNLWLVTKETPYSLKMDLAAASIIIENRLRECFYWVDEIDLNKYSQVALSEWDSRIKIYDLAKIREDWYSACYADKEFLLNNSDVGRALKKLWTENTSMIVNICKITGNYAQGLYEVQYWATEPV